MFVDRAIITVKAGNGGDGMTSFLRYKGIATGGPDGGDGGHGGAIIFEADSAKSSLLDFYYTKKYTAENGERGGTNNCTGKCGEDLIIKVPCGTVVKDFESGAIIADVYQEGDRVVIEQGGRGGKGNVKFTTSRRHTPHFSQKGERTVVRKLALELLTIADVGLVGFPNVGKSTMLSRISSARPKIANYHFTTLSPNLGAVKYYDRSFVVADIPGLIEGAADGAGLGHDFLRHIERTRMTVHVVDISGCEGRDPYEDYLKINEELSRYSAELASKPMIIAANKTDILEDQQTLVDFEKKVGQKVFAVSAATGDGVKRLIDEVARVLETLPPPKPIEHEVFTYERPDESSFEIVRDDDGAYVVLGPLVDLLERNVVLDDSDSLAYFQKTLRDKNVIKELRKAGAKDGDTVVIGEIEFDFID